MSKPILVPDNPDELLKQKTSHGTFLGDIKIDFGRQALECGFPSIEANEYLLANRGNMLVMAARAGNGKTSLACQIGLEVSKHKKVLFYSLEMNKEAIMERLVSVVGGIPIRQLKNPKWEHQLVKTMLDMRQYQFKIIDTPKLGVKDIKSQVYDEHRNGGVGLVIIDYAGLLSGDTTAQRHLSIAGAASAIKTDIADKLKIPVILLAQMNQGIDGRQAQAELKDRNGEEGPPVRPMLADIGESKGIADSADCVFFLRRPCLYNPTADRELFHVYVLKNRNGPTNDFVLKFSESMTRFYDSGELL